MSTSQTYAPPAHPPPKKPLLKSSATALNYTIDLEKLANQGWATIDISDDPSDQLRGPYKELFEASAQFFHLPREQRVKYRIPALKGGQKSEEGYSVVKGEKRMITLRKAETTPIEFGLREKAVEAWKASACVMWEVLRAIEQSLGMQDGVLLRLMERQEEMPKEGEANVASLVRMFRYERPRAPSAPPPSAQSSNSSSESGADADGVTDGHLESRVVAEPHKDLGLLTIVIGHSPGLECYDSEKEEWVSCETKEGLNATIMTGQTLVKFTNGRYVSGRHRVLVHPGPPPSRAPNDTIKSKSDLLTNPLHRFSLVHALRAHLPLRVSSSEFESPVTGTFPPPLRFENVLMEQIYQAISDAHWNINIAVAERRKQERRLRELAEKERKEKEKTEKEKSASGGDEKVEKTDGGGAGKVRKRSYGRFFKLRHLLRKTTKQAPPAR